MLTMNRRDIEAAAEFLRTARPATDLRGKAVDRAAFMAWRGLCLREAQRHAQTMDISAFLTLCGSPD
jgi:hypothetical protein